MASLSETFCEGAERRIETIFRGLTLAVGAALWVTVGTRWTAGFFAGALVAYLNFHWLHRIASQFLDAALKSSSGISGWSVPLQAVLRFALLLTCVYVIFKRYPAAIPGLLAGLFLPILAAVCEGVYEAYVMVRRGGENPF